MTSVPAVPNWQPSGHLAPIVCAHRGASAVAPENTIAAVHAAAAANAAWIEFDVRPCAGAELVVHHDPATATGQVVADTSFADLDDSIPTFAAFTQAAGSLGLDVELKTDEVGMSTQAYVELVAAELDEHCADWDPSLLMVTSFDTDALDLFHELRPAVATGVLFHDRTGNWAINRATEQGHTAIVPWYRIVTAAMVDQAHVAGLGVSTWTVNHAIDAARMIECGVDMIIGDDPAAIHTWIAG